MCLGCGSEPKVLLILASRASLNGSSQLQFAFSFTWKLCSLKTSFVHESSSSWPSSEQEIDFKSSTSLLLLPPSQRNFLFTASEVKTSLNFQITARGLTFQRSLQEIRKGVLLTAN